MPDRRRPSRRTTGRRRNRGPLLVGVLLCVFWIVTGVFLLRRLDSSSSLGNNGHHNVRARRTGIQAAGPTLGSDRHPEQDGTPPERSYEGWQPLPLSTSHDGKGCDDWRACFKVDHACPGKCRDSLEEWGVPPPLPPQQPWIPDVTVLRRQYLAGVDARGEAWPPPLVTKHDRGLCERIGPMGDRVDQNADMIRHVPLSALSFKSDDKHRPKVFCFVYTMAQNHHTNVRAMRETWAGGCDGFLAFSTVNDPRIPAISIPHDGPEAYNNMWQKVRSMLQYVGTHYLDDFDFFFQGGDDLYVLPENLRQYLHTAVRDPDTEDFFGGRRFQFGRNADVLFNSGGAGYALSRATLRRLSSPGGLDHPRCSPTKRTSMEDVTIARCLQDVLGVGVVDTRDDRGRERFHPFSPGTHYYWRHPVPPKTDWYETYNQQWPPQLKEDCCAPDSVSFHYLKKPAMVRHLHALLYQCGGSN